MSKGYYKSKNRRFYITVIVGLLALVSLNGVIVIQYQRYKGLEEDISNYPQVTEVKKEVFEELDLRYDIVERDHLVLEYNEQEELIKVKNTSGEINEYSIVEQEATDKEINDAVYKYNRIRELGNKKIDLWIVSIASVVASTLVVILVWLEIEDFKEIRKSYKEGS